MNYAISYRVTFGTFKGNSVTMNGSAFSNIPRQAGEKIFIVSEGVTGEVIDSRLTARPAASFDDNLTPTQTF